ncbi:ribonuclease 3-like protein [Musa troglodytarum]|uniref:Ribonuclease 3-like protein n=1 Tax=Musa troglodytarum TaxID=320322 RepID=A0A9E7GV82_9LILI|nr:ribonuclease 3-like protein [Musa troglodytarum]
MKRSCPEAEERDGGLRRAVTEIERLLGYVFRDHSLLAEALTHSSYPDHRSYQRLEFVGDAALSLAITNHLYLTNPDLGPGRLSALRAANISTEKLARVAVRHRLYRFLRRNSHALDQMVFDFTNLVMVEREEEIGWAPYGGSTVKAPKVLADIVESIAGAVYVDCNFDLELLWKVFRGILEPIITSENMDEQPVTTLYELCQKQGRSIEIKNWKRGFVNITNAFVDGDLMGIGCSEQKTIAKLNAARDALQKLSALEEPDMEVELSSAAGNGTAEEKGGSKQKLSQFCSKKHWIMPIYKIEKEQGPAHSRRFICSVQVETKRCTFITFGDPKSRVKDAENSAAFKMLSDFLVGH